jgi:ketosteroid isomerase-like protein
MSGEQHPNALLIKKLYTGIKNADLDAIGGCYTDDAYFEDIAFKRSGKKHVMEMWRFVCHSRPAVTILSFSADDQKGSGRWNAKYMYGKTNTKPGRPVDNTLTSEFVFRDGRIVSHRDNCDAMAWARQAFPFPASLIAGAIEPLRRHMATRKLDKFLEQSVRS